MTTTRLFPIELQGIGTSEVESLPSYIHRIAWEHGVYVGELLRFVYALGQSENCNISLVEMPKYVKVSELIRPNRTTSMISALLERYTGQRFGNALLWVLQGELARSSKEIVDGFRWCPECFSEMASLGNTPYFKLIWHMSAVSACPFHRSPLVNKCGFCGDPQTTFIKKYGLGHCQNCGTSLSERKRRLKHSDIRSSWEDVGQDIVELFVDVSALEPAQLAAGGVRKSISELFNYYRRNGREDAFNNCLSKDLLLAIVDKQMPISLKSARRIAYNLGLSLFDLLSGNASQTTESLDQGLFCRLPPSYLSANKKKKRDHSDVVYKIEYVIKRSECPLPLKELARRVDVSVGYLQYRYPVFAKDVIRQHAEYTEQEKQKRMLYARKVALDFFLEEKYSKYPQSRKQAYRILREETGLPKFLLKRSIESAYQALH